MGKVDDLRALREAKYGPQRDRRPIGLASKEPVRKSNDRAPQAAVMPEAVAVPRPATTEAPSPSAVPAVIPDAIPEGTPTTEEASTMSTDVLVKEGKPIQAYSQAELEQIVSDLFISGMSADDMINQVCVALGFQRRGKVIKIRVREAFEARCA